MVAGRYHSDGFSDRFNDLDTHCKFISKSNCEHNADQAPKDE
jgi:hypothetical protein